MIRFFKVENKHKKTGRLLASYHPPLVSVRSRCHTQALSLAGSLAKDANVLEAKPRTCRRQINRSNLPADDVSEYYKRSNYSIDRPS